MVTDFSSSYFLCCILSFWCSIEMLHRSAVLLTLNQLFCLLPFLTFLFLLLRFLFFFFFLFSVFSGRSYAVFCFLWGKPNTWSVGSCISRVCDQQVSLDHAQHLHQTGRFGALGLVFLVAQIMALRHVASQVGSRRLLCMCFLCACLSNLL